MRGLISALLALTVILPATAGAQTVTVAAEPDKPKLKTPHFTVYNYQGEQPVMRADGMGLFAKSKDSAVDLASPDRMVDGPSGSLFNQAAGLGWRNHNISAMVGYMKPSSVKSATEFSDEHTPTFKSSARFGLGWSLHF